MPGGEGDPEGGGDAWLLALLDLAAAHAAPGEPLVGGHQRRVIGYGERRVVEPYAAGHQSQIEMGVAATAEIDRAVALLDDHQPEDVAIPMQRGLEVAHADDRVIQGSDHLAGKLSARRYSASGATGLHCGADTSPAGRAGARSRPG